MKTKAGEVTWLSLDCGSFVIIHSFSKYLWNTYVRQSAGPCRDHSEQDR